MLGADGTPATERDDTSSRTRLFCRHLAENLPFGNPAATRATWRWKRAVCHRHPAHFRFRLDLMLAGLKADG
jgi:hypothetical protein